MRAFFHGDTSILDVESPSGLTTYYFKIDLLLAENGKADGACKDHHKHTGAEARFDLDIIDRRRIEAELVRLFPELLS